MTTYVDTIQKGAPLGSAGYQIEVQMPGQLPLLLPRQAYFSLQPFQNPEGVPSGTHRVLFCQASGERANLEPGMDIYVDLDFGAKPAKEAQQSTKSATQATEPAAEACERAPLPEGLHPAAESYETMEQEIFSQHIERNEYSNFKLRSETRTVECLYSFIQRMGADQQALFQHTMEAPRRMTLEFKQMVDTMGEAMKSFHSMVELQSVTMQAIQKQMEIARVPAPPPPPPDYVGLGKTLLEILRDLGMKAMDAGYVRRPLASRKVQELPEIRDAEVNEPIRQTQSERSAPVDDSSVSEDGSKAAAAEELRRVLSRMGEVDIARAFSGPEGFQDFLAGVRREIDAGRAQAASQKTPASAADKATASAGSAAPEAASQKTPPPPVEVSSQPSAQTVAPQASQTSPVASGWTPRPASAQTPGSLKHGQQQQGSRPQHGPNRR